MISVWDKAVEDIIDLSEEGGVLPTREQVEEILKRVCGYFRDAGYDEGYGDGYGDGYEAGATLFDL